MHCLLAVIFHWIWEEVVSWWWAWNSLTHSSFPPVVRQRSVSHTHAAGGSRRLHAAARVCTSLIFQRIKLLVKLQKFWVSNEPTPSTGVKVWLLSRRVWLFSGSDCCQGLTVVKVWLLSVSDYCQVFHRIIALFFSFLFQFCEFSNWRSHFSRLFMLRSRFLFVWTWTLFSSCHVSSKRCSSPDQPVVFAMWFSPVPSDPPSGVFRCTLGERVLSRPLWSQWSFPSHSLVPTDPTR